MLLGVLFCGGLRDVDGAIGIIRRRHLIGRPPCPPWRGLDEKCHQPDKQRQQGDDHAKSLQFELTFGRSGRAFGRRGPGSIGGFWRRWAARRVFGALLFELGLGLPRLLISLGL